jgi:twinkle protein
MANVELLEGLGIDLKKRFKGTLKTTCPACSESRRNKKDPCLSVDIDEGVYNCHHCEFKGRVFEKRVKEYVKPLPRLEKVGKKVLEFFEIDRKISNETLLKMKISESVEFLPALNQKAPVICFNYFRADDLVNIKFRGPQKSFGMAKDAELIFYNLNAMDDETAAVIVEGEIDCLSMIEAGIFNCVSVPNGASKGNQKLEYLDNSWDSVKGLAKVILATDDDEPGKSLREELARRIGKERCWTVEYPQGCKDANDVLVKFGSSALSKMIEEAKQWPLEGIVTMEEIFPVLQDWYLHGYPEGTKAGIKGFDHLLRFIPGQVTTITGIPGHGKDEFFNDVMAGLAKNEGWPIAVCGFEESPAETASKLAEKLTRKSFAFRKNKDDRMNQIGFEWAVSLIDKFFHFFNTEDGDTTIEGILKTASILVGRFGIKALYCNPWNWIEHARPAWQSETEYVSFIYTKVIMFARKCGVHVFIIAHTTKMGKDKVTGKYIVPTLYDISGSANFFNKTHNGVTVYLDYQTGIVTVYVQKVKQSWLGKTGFSSYQYNTQTRQYTFLDSSILFEESSNGVPELSNGSWRKIESINYSEPISKDEEDTF